MCNSLHGMEQQEWFRDWIAPVRDAMYIHDREAAGREIVRRCALLPGSDLTDWQREVVQYTYSWYRFLVRVQGRPRAESCGHYRKAVEHFSESALTARGETQRRRLLIMLRGTGWLYGCTEFGRADLDELLGGLPDLDTDEFLWHHIAGWAFANRDLELVNRAFEVLLAHPSNLLGQAKWQRVNIMLQLLTGKAKRRDVEETIRGMEVLPQIMEFRHHIWPVCIEQGLVDAQLEQMLADATARIQDNPPAPDIEPRTKRIRGRS